jgi:hypothetical protein
MDTREPRMDEIMLVLGLIVFLCHTQCITTRLPIGVVYIEIYFIIPGSYSSNDATNVTKSLSHDRSIVFTAANRSRSSFRSLSDTHTLEYHSLNQKGVMLTNDIVLAVDAAKLLVDVRYRGANLPFANGSLGNGPNIRNI